MSSDDLQLDICDALVLSSCDTTRRKLSVAWCRHGAHLCATFVFIFSSISSCVSVSHQHVLLRRIIRHTDTEYRAELPLTQNKI